jgi:hypothetical protein
MGGGAGRMAVGRMGRSAGVARMHGGYGRHYARGGWGGWGGCWPYDYTYTYPYCY